MGFFSSKSRVETTNQTNNSTESSDNSVGGTGNLGRSATLAKDKAVLGVEDE